MLYVNPGLAVRTGLLLQVTVAAGRLAMAAGAVVSTARAVDELGINSVGRAPILSPVGAGSERIEVVVASFAGKGLFVAGPARIHVAGTRVRHALLLVVARMADLAVKGLVTAMGEHQARQSRALRPFYLMVLFKVAGSAVVARFFPIADIVAVLAAPRAPFHGHGNHTVLAVAVGAIHLILAHVKSVAEADGRSRLGFLLF